MRRSRLARTAMKKKPAREPAALTAARREVMERSEGRCEIALPDCLGAGTELHHRKLRRHGDHRPVNLLAACSWCHAGVHAWPKTSYKRGWLVHSHDDPGLVAVVGRSATREPREPQDPDPGGVGVGGQQT